ncbi:Adaptive-response sensory-kinase SasA [subsurface metagenome]
MADSFNKMAEDLQTTTTSIDNLNREIAERRKAEYELKESENRFQQIVSNASEWVWEVDSDGLYTYSSPVIEDLLGYKPEEIVGKKHFYDLFVPENRDEIKRSALEKFAEKESFKGFLNANVHKNGQTVWIMTSGVPILDDDGNLVGYRGSDIDITDRKEAEKKLERLNENLEDTIAKLGRANSELKDFVYIASHDLREPIRKISSFGELLSASLKDKLNDDDKENLGFMVDGATRMQQMIDALLTYSRVTTKGIDFEPVDLNKVVEELCTVELAVKIEEIGAKIMTPERLHSVNCDPAQIRQLMQNLVANGLKYQKEGVVPEITIRSSVTDNDMIRVEVTDNGIGIKQEQFKDVFVMFKRLHSRQKYEGAGIGLAVCKKIVERHGGDIGVSSTYGQGATFWFTLPVLKTPAEKQSETSVALRV